MAISVSFLAAAMEIIQSQLLAGSGDLRTGFAFVETLELWHASQEYLRAYCGRLGTMLQACPFHPDSRTAQEVCAVLMFSCLP